MRFTKTLFVSLAILLMAYALPVLAQEQSIQDAAKEVEAAIQSAMSRAGQGNGPTLGQLGGVQAGSTGSDAGGGAGGGESSGGGSGGGGSCCFLPGTLIAMADGSAKPIETVKIGDMVLSFDPETGKTSHEEVLELETPIRDHHYIMTFSDGSELKLTDEHPLWAMVAGKKGWASINPANTLRYDNMETLPLKVGDTVYTKDGKWVAITKFEKKTGDVQTYNLSGISNTHTFFADEIGAHNKGCFAPDTLVLMADDTSKPIVDIKGGDKVASWDFGKNAMTTVTVEHIYTVKRDHFYIVDGIRVTSEHPYCTAPGQYTEVQHLKEGTPIASVTDDGIKFTPITDFTKVNKAGTFHNMTVSGTHTYIVSPQDAERERGRRKLVHNKGSGI